MATWHSAASIHTYTSTYMAKSEKKRKKEQTNVRNELKYIFDLSLFELAWN